jgi:hypothetical protein
MISASCSSSGRSVTEPEPRVEVGRYVGSNTGNAAVPAVVLDRESRALLGVVAGDGPASAPGATFIQDGHQITVLRHPNGLPARMVVDGDALFLFENYTESTVDIAIVSNGQVQKTRRVPFNATRASALLTSSSAVRTQSLTGPRLDAADIDLNQVIKNVALVLNIAVCTATILSAAVSWPAIALACSSTLITFLVDGAGQALVGDLKILLDYGDQLKAVAEWFNCFAPNPASLLSCIAASIDSARAVAARIIAIGESEALKDLLTDYRISGYVGNAKTGVVIGSALVEILNPNRVGVRTLGDGSYSLAPFPDVAGTYNMMASAPGYRAGNRTVTLIAGGAPITVNFLLEPEAGGGSDPPPPPPPPPSAPPPGTGPSNPAAGTYTGAPFQAASVFNDGAYLWDHAFVVEPSAGIGSDGRGAFTFKIQITSQPVGNTNPAAVNRVSFTCSVPVNVIGGAFAGSAVCGSWTQSIGGQFAGSTGSGSWRLVTNLSGSEDTGSRGFSVSK